MALMGSAPYDALRSANVDDDKARRAVEEVADLQKQRGTIEVEIAAVRGDKALLTWMLGFVLASNVALLFKVSYS